MSQSLSQALFDLSTQDIDENPWLYEEIAKRAAEARDLEESARHLESEVDRLREELKAANAVCRLTQRYEVERDAYRAAVAELRRVLVNEDCGDIGFKTREVLVAFLDKLPRESD